MRVVRVERRCGRTRVGVRIRSAEQLFDPFAPPVPGRALGPLDAMRLEDLRELAPPGKARKLGRFLNRRWPVLAGKDGEYVERPDVRFEFRRLARSLEPRRMLASEPEAVEGLRLLVYSTPGSGSRRM